ncbi:TM2 domain-containing protein 3-like isoform X1 [Clavelina lepadiformis]|uniref:TM2 domain-containing protein 3-like isoform X1 n=1 Tax=Clavelina lepadiformis TaxID=159417 RepID=UPI00404338C6
MRPLFCHFALHSSVLTSLQNLFLCNGQVFGEGIPCLTCLSEDRMKIARTKSPTNLIPNESALKCSGNCTRLPASCYKCDTSDNCLIGQLVKFNCTVNETCNGPKFMQKTFQCQYCFLTKENKEHTCTQNNTSCKANGTPLQRVKGKCIVNKNIFCLGNRTFSKMMPCSWTTGYSWSTAFTLSITVGGFGIDRFYLGYWREGLGKFFSFGGLGIWTLVDVVLIGSGYLTPSDGSLYVY